MRSRSGGIHMSAYRFLVHHVPTYRTILTPPTLRAPTHSSLPTLSYLNLDELLILHTHITCLLLTLPLCALQSCSSTTNTRPHTHRSLHVVPLESKRRERGIAQEHHNHLILLRSSSKQKKEEGSCEEGIRPGVTFRVWRDG